MGIQPRVEILLATYNGQQFIRQQIDSLLGQDYDHLSVLARDDGSSDGTQKVLEQYAQLYPGRFGVVESGSTNGGILNNFLSLMKASSSDYVCFSDQDDVWLPDKVSKTKRVMEGLELKWGNQTPLLVFTDLRVVDENLETLYPSFWVRMGIDPEWINQFGRLLGNPVVTGCTAMVNRRLLELAFDMPREASLHDRWMGHIASAMGKAGFLREQTVLYRQHGRNAIGIGNDEAPRSLFRRIPDYARSGPLYVAAWQSSQEQAAAFLKVHGADLPAKKREELMAFRRCETSGNRFVRAATFVSHRFYYSGSRWSKIAVFFHLWSSRSTGDQTFGITRP